MAAPRECSSKFLKPFLIPTRIMDINCVCPNPRSPTCQYGFDCVFCVFRCVTTFDCCGRYMNSGVSIAVNRVDSCGCSALHVAVFLGWEAVMELLINGPTKFQEKSNGANFCDVDKVRNGLVLRCVVPRFQPSPTFHFCCLCCVLSCINGLTRQRQMDGLR